MRFRLITRGLTLFVFVIFVAVHAMAQSVTVTPRASFSAAIDARTLFIRGTNASESIIAEVSGGRGESIAVSSGASRSAFRLDAFDRIELAAGGGADFVNIIDPAELLDARKKILKIDAGDGDNVVVLSHAAFAPETAARMRELATLAGRLQDIAKRAADATANVLANDALRQIERVRSGIVDEANAIAADARTQIFTPANQLVEKDGPRAVETGNALLKRVDNLAKQHERLVADLTKQLDPTNGVFPPDDDREPATEPTGREPRPEEREPREGIVRAEQEAAFALSLGRDAEAQLGRAGADIERAAGEVEARAEELERRAGRLAEEADRIAAESESTLTSSSERVLTIVGELQSVTAQLNDATAAARTEIQRAIELAAGRAPQTRLAAAGTTCPTLTPAHTFAGGPGFDLFLPFSAPWQSWSINGGNGFNILFGGFADDLIQGGNGTDIVFGLSGNDQIHGGAGIDLLFGEFLFEFSWMTGDDCIWGDADVDLVVGDNGIGISSGTPGGNDTLKGGADIDLVFGDDITDIVNNSLPGGLDDIEGNDGIDLLFGCGARDDIRGNDDIDLAVGNGGDDVIHGNDGRDITIGSSTIHVGNLLLGTPGDDEIHGGKGIDVLFGNDGNDRMWGDDQLNNITIGAQADLMFAGAGDDEVRGESGGVIVTISGVPIRFGNVMWGGRGKDRIWGGGDPDVAFGQQEDDDIRGFELPFQPLGIDMDVLFGGAGNDYVEGDNEYALLLTSNDFIFGGDGNDHLFGGSNHDFMFGEDGNDAMEGDSNSLALLPSMDLMFGGPGLDTMNGGNFLDVMFGGRDNDTMKGDNETANLLSMDLMFGGLGDDAMNGGNNLDLLFGEPGADMMLGDSNLLSQPFSTDLMFGGPGPDDMNGGNGIDVMFGGPGCDRMAGDTSIQGVLSSDFMWGNEDDDDMDGGVSPDFMWGNSGNDTMIGDNGQTWMVASLDLMWGNDGCDTISGGRAIDLLWGNSGVDQIDGQWGPDLIWGNENGDTINGGDSFDLLWGNDGNDLIHGDSGLDLIWGNDGDDCLYGDADVDLIWGGNGNDCLHGGSHADLLWGNDDNDLIFGDNGPDVGFGNSGDDQLDGGSGADVLVGNAGTDEAWGGPGFDLLFAETTHQSGNSGLDCSCNTEVCRGTICIRKFNDPNGNGVQNTGETGLQNWTFQVTCGCTATSLTTDANGNACGTFFSGNCTVAETLQNGWTPTTPATQNTTVNSGQTSTVSFGNRRTTGQLCIHKFNDANANGVQDSSELPLGSFVFQITGGGASTTATTNAQGDACLTLQAGTYTVTEQPMSGWIATTAVSVSVVVSSGQTANATFGNRRATNGEICIFKFEDRNRNGVQDSGEPGLSGWVFQVGSVATLTTLSAGGICSGVPGGTHTVTEVPKSGWIATTPASVVVTINGGLTNLRFGNVKQ